jgi:hypothetical protein
MSQTHVLRALPPEVLEANREFIRRHPERGGRLPRPDDPRDRAAMAEWRQLHAKAKARNQPTTPRAQPSRPTLPCQANKSQCELVSAEIKCEHFGAPRKFKINLPQTNPQLRFIEVIAGNQKTKESITVASKWKKLLCNEQRHKTRHIIVKPPNNGAEIVTGNPTLKFDVKSSLVVPTARTAPGVLNLLWKYIWPARTTKDIYYVDFGACTVKGPVQAQVRVYPDIQWWIEVGIAYGVDRSRTRASKFARGAPPNIQSEMGQSLSLEFKASFKYDGKQQDVGQEFKTTFGQRAGWWQATKLISSWLRKIAYYAGNVKLSFPQMAWGFKYTSTIAEHPDKAVVRRDVDVEFTADPLFGAGVEVDLLELLIRAAGNGAVGLGIACGPAVAQFLLNLKRRAAEGVSFFGVQGKATVALTLGIKGSIGGRAAGQFRDGGPSEASGTLEGKLTFTFGGVAAVEGKVLQLVVTAGVSLTGEAAFAAGLQFGHDTEKGFFWGGKMYFAGAKLEFRTFYDVKIKRQPPRAAGNSERATKSGWTVTWPAWPDEGAYKKRYLVG